MNDAEKPSPIIPLNKGIGIDLKALREILEHFAKGKGPLADIKDGLDVFELICLMDTVRNMSNALNLPMFLGIYISTWVFDRMKKDKGREIIDAIAKCMHETLDACEDMYAERKSEK